MAQASKITVLVIEIKATIFQSNLRYILVLLSHASYSKEIYTLSCISCKTIKGPLDFMFDNPTLKVKT